MSTEKIACKECEKQVDSMEFLFRHLRSHKISSKDYILKWKYDNKIPPCSCGCGGESNWNVSLRDFTRFIQGHHAHGRIKSDEEKAKIGKKNSENMKRWMGKHPDVALKRGRLMNQATLTPEVQRKKSEAMFRFWSSSPLAADLRSAASQRAIALLAENKIGPQAPFKREWKRNPWTGEDEYMHSSWESAFFDACVTRSYEVTKNHGIAIPYDHPDGTMHTYVPDFYATEDRTLYEVKGRWDEVDTAKWCAAREWCAARGMGFEVVLSPETR